MIVDIYARKSTADQGRSIASQEDECRLTAADERWTVGRVFADDDRSASRYAKRERADYAALLDHLRSGACEMLMLWEASRGSRELGEWVAFLDVCRKRGTLVHIVTHRRTYDVRNRRDWRTLVDEGVDAADESERIAERTQRGKRAAAQKGLPAGQLLYGYRRIYDDRGNYVEQVEHPEQAAVIREAAACIAAGETLGSIARRLTERGIPSPRGGKWDGSHLGRLVMNPAFIARRIHRGEDVGPAAWPAILDAETYRVVCERLRDPSRRTQRGTALKWLLAGVPVCYACEGKMGTFKGNALRRYTCRGCKRTAIKADPLDEFVTEHVLARLRRPDADRLFAPPVDDGKLTEAREAEAALRLRLDSFYDQAAAGKLTADGLAKLEARLNPEIEAAAERVRRLSTPPVLRGLAGIDVPGRWETLAITTKRDVVMAIVDLRVGPAIKGRGFFDPGRLRESRWRGDTKTWGQHWDEMAEA
ncbi:Resolvase domain protein [Micromonospora sp. L5]|uniref:recombinase family protein n=1 Tax=Micromonospora sp. (strain L5) TaxID=648999 RepID=UPI0001C437AB|nr:recombinase family protein [Micromonospora sp. L5]ADU07183.1 Resolvase domain protein [Micromonospora sp. L5]